MKTGNEIFDEYRTRMGQSAEKIRKGVQTTDKDQAAEAAKAKDRMMENHAKAMADGKWERGLANAGHDKWERNMVAKGIPKNTAGIDANKDEIVQKFDKVARVGEKVKREVATMPKGGIENGVNRVRRAMETTIDEWRE